MFRHFLLVAITLPTISAVASSVSACTWSLEPTVLLLTSYDQAQNQNSNDQLVYQQLQTIYGKNHVITLFSSQDDNYYATMLRNFLSIYNIKKVFILNPSFQKYIPHSSSDTSMEFSNNLVRVLQQFQYVKFYFFNNIIADTIKVNNNIYDIRFNSANVAVLTPDSYGNQLAQHFIDNIKAGINNKYNFDSDNTGKPIVKIGIINNIGTNYNQTILNQFINKITNTIDNIKYEIISVKPGDNFVTSNIYSADGIKIIGQISQELYEQYGVNFIINTNSWYNNIIAYAASLVSSRPTYNKTIEFIGCDIVNKNNYIYKNHNYLTFGFTPGLEIFKETANPEINSSFKIALDLPESKTQTYGVNSISFTS